MRNAELVEPDGDLLECRDQCLRGRIIEIRRGAGGALLQKQEAAVVDHAAEADGVNLDAAGISGGAPNGLDVVAELDLLLVEVVVRLVLNAVQRYRSSLHERKQ